MTTDPPDPITAAAARYKRDNEKAKASRKELAALVIDALRDPKAEPIDIARRAEWTPAYVRKLARENGIQADPSYKARTEKARARLLSEASPSPAAAGRPQVTQAVRKPVPSISAKVSALGAARAKELAARLEDRYPEWVEEIGRDYPHLRGPDLDLVIVEVGLQKGFRIPDVAKPPEEEFPDRPITEEEAAEYAALARSRASEMELKKLDQVAGYAPDGSKNITVMLTALNMDLLKRSEVYGLASGEETTG